MQLRSFAEVTLGAHFPLEETFSGRIKLKKRVNWMEESLKPVYKILLLIQESLQCVHACRIMQSVQPGFVLADSVKARVQGQ